MDFTSDFPNTVFKWTNNNTSIGLRASGTGDIPPFTLKNTTSSNITATITVIPTLNGCDGDSQTFTITVKPSVYFTTQPVSSSVCLNGTAQTLSVAYANGTGTPQYQWYSNTTNNNSGGTIISGATLPNYDPPTNSVGTKYYYCIVTLPDDICGTIVSDVATVTVVDVPTIDKNPLATQQICVGGEILPLSVSTINGVGTPTYQWYYNTTNSNIGGNQISGATSSSYTPPAFNATGNFYYYVVVNYSASACGVDTSHVAEVVVVADPVITSQPVPTQSICQNTTPTDLTVVVSGGTGSFIYQWYSNTTNSTVNGQIITTATSATFTPPANVIGTKYYYCVISQSGLGCQVISAISEVKIIAAPTITSQPQSATVCIGESVSTLSVSYKDGVGTPQYQWYKNEINDNISGTTIDGATNSTYSPPSTNVGTVYYYCEITLPSGGCNKIVSNTAKITINPYPVISDFTRRIASGTTFTVAPTNNPPTDIVPSGTTYTWTAPLIQPAGAISGATAQLTPQIVISQLLTNNTKSAATVNYTVTPVSNGCIGEAFNVVVTVDPPITVNAVVENITCFGTHNGYINLDISGGATPYKVEWTGPNGFSSTLEDISQLSAGNYLLKVTDSVGISYSNTYTIKEPDELALTTTNRKDVTCFNATDGKISVLVTGGTPPYKYLWTKDGNQYASDTADIDNLQPGEYKVVVTDVNNCGPGSETYTITEPQAMSITILDKQDLKCFGDSTGFVSVEVGGGTPKEISPGVFGYNYSWTGPNGFTSMNKNIENLKAGSYSLEVTDNNGCTQYITTEIKQPDEIFINVIQKPVSCYGANDASIKISISGGISPYQIEWSNFAKGDYLTDLGPGTYTVKITDTNSCVATKEIIIEETPFSFHPVIKNVSCNGAQDGSISLNISGGVPPISLAWDDDALAGATRNRLKAGTYTVKISDASCSFTKSFTIVEPLAINIAAKITDAFDCNNPNSGSINLVVEGGTEPYKYEWSNGQTTKDLINIPAGVYILNLTDNNGCEFSKQFEIKRQKPLELSAEVTPDFNCSTGQLKMKCIAQVSGGMPPYNFSWSSGEVSGDNNEIMETAQSGIVTLTVTDNLNCTMDYTFELQVPNVGIEFQMMDCDERKYAFNALIPYGQPSDYTFLWNFGDGNTSTLQNTEHSYSASGTYNVTLIMKNSTCETIFEKSIEVVSSPVLLLDKEPVFCFGDSILLRVSGAQSYEWFNGSASDSILIKNAGDYSVRGINKYGCSSILNFSAKNFESYKYTIQSDKNEVSPDNSEIQLWSDNIPNSEYYWDFGDGNFASGYIQKHTYTIVKDGYFDVNLKVKNPDGCIENAVKRIWIINGALKNTFSPNGDGIDDIYMKGWHIKIYNRNGVLLYNGNEGWDGTYKGGKVNNDTYFVVVYYPTAVGIKTSTGYVTVIR